MALEKTQASGTGGRGAWAGQGGGDGEAVRCLAILLVRHLLDAVVVPARARRGERAMDAEERLDMVAAGIIAAEALMQKNMPLTLKALARHYASAAGAGGSD
jgi:hypothetical protein